MRKTLFLLFIGLSSFSVLAQNEDYGPIVTDRPDQTEASSTVYPGALQIESGFTYMTTDFKTANPRGRMSQEIFALPNTLFRVGLIENFELRIVTQPEIQRMIQNDEVLTRTAGLADLEVGFKVRMLAPAEGRPEIGFLSHLVFPSGTDGLSNENYGVINKLAVTHTFSDKHSVAWNIGYDYLGEGNGDFFYSLAWGIGLSDKLGLYFEPYGYMVNLEDWEASADAGFTYLLNDNMQFDYSFGLGINHEMNYHSVGLSIRLPR